MFFGRVSCTNQLLPGNQARVRASRQLHQLLVVAQLRHRASLDHCSQAGGGQTGLELRSTAR